jgi:hypothetical protein
MVNCALLVALEESAVGEDAVEASAEARSAKRR